jgi:mRNA export factor
MIPSNSTVEVLALDTASALRQRAPGERAPARRRRGKLGEDAAGRPRAAHAGLWGGAMSSFGTAAAAQQPHNPNNDILLTNPPNDTVQSMAFSPGALGPKTYLVAGSWDNEVRCWDVQANGTSSAVGAIKHDGPVLDVAWSGDGQAVFSSSADKTGKMWQLATNQQTTIAGHDAAIRHIFYAADMGNGSPCVVTGSWDKSIRYWDLRAPSSTPMGTIPLSDKVYAMDCRSPLLVVGTADRQLRVYDIRKPQQPFHEKMAQLKHQFRCLATFPDRSGYAVGSVEGRVSIDHISEADRKSSDFAFKCHRDTDGERVIYAVNAISFHEGYNTFSTAGADGGTLFPREQATSGLPHECAPRLTWFGTVRPTSRLAPPLPQVGTSGTRTTSTDSNRQASKSCAPPPDTRACAPRRPSGVLTRGPALLCPSPVSTPQPADHGDGVQCVRLYFCVRGWVRLEQGCRVQRPEPAQVRAAARGARCGNQGQEGRQAGAPVGVRPPPAASDELPRLCGRGRSACRRVRLCLAGNEYIGSVSVPKPKQYASEVQHVDRSCRFMSSFGHCRGGVAAGGQWR